MIVNNRCSEEDVENTHRGRTNMQKAISLLFAVELLAGAANQQTFTGVITDSMCGNDHAMMKVRPDSKCVLECVKQGSKYGLYDGKTTYVLSDQ